MENTKQERIQHSLYHAGIFIEAILGLMNDNAKTGKEEQIYLLAETALEKIKKSRDMIG